MSESKSCTWSEDEDGVWETSCGHDFVFTENGPTENGAKFCQYCGKPLIENKWWKGDSDE